MTEIMYQKVKAQFNRLYDAGLITLSKNAGDFKSQLKIGCDPGLEFFEFAGNIATRKGQLKDIKDRIWDPLTASNFALEGMGVYGKANGDEGKKENIINTCCTRIEYLDVLNEQTHILDLYEKYSNELNMPELFVKSLFSGMIKSVPYPKSVRLFKNYLDTQGEELLDCTSTPHSDKDADYYYLVSALHSQNTSLRTVRIMLVLILTGQQ